MCRVRALGHLQQLLSSDYVGLAVEQLLASVGVVLQKGPGVQDIACGGMGERVREVFGSVMRAVVELASKQPASCINTIAMLCIVPFTRLVHVYVQFRLITTHHILCIDCKYVCVLKFRTCNCCTKLQAIIHPVIGTYNSVINILKVHTYSVVLFLFIYTTYMYTHVVCEVNPTPSYTHIQTGGGLSGAQWAC